MALIRINPDTFFQKLEKAGYSRDEAERAADALYLFPRATKRDLEAGLHRQMWIFLGALLVQAAVVIAVALHLR